MIRAVFRRIFGLILRIFFPRIELHNIERVPATGPVIFVMNHPNALIDPAFMLCLAPRPVSFLAKSTLFKIPVVGWLTRGFDSLPVYRREEGGDRSGNQETFDLARALLQRGGTLALFPEGASHSDPAMRPFKTGAARIALGAGVEGLQIMPVGLYYHAKETFRSAALLSFGQPFEVAPVTPLEDGSLPREAVHALTDRIRQALDEVTLQAEQREALELTDRAHRIFMAAEEDDDEDSLAEGFELHQRFVEGYHTVKQAHPEALAALEARVARYEEDLARLGLNAEHPAPEQFTWGGSLSYALRSLFWLGLPLPVAAVGTVVHYPAYRLVGHLATRMAKGEQDMVSTIKILAAMLFFPLTWALVGLVVGLAAAPWWWGLVAGALAPLAGVVAMRFHERFGRVRAATRGLVLFLTRRRLFERLHDERRQIRAEILALAAALEAGAP